LLTRNPRSGSRFLGRPSAISAPSSVNFALKTNPTIERIGALACLDFDMLRDKIKSFRFREAFDRRFLRLHTPVTQSPR
jgi:hypothetical protein